VVIVARITRPTLTEVNIVQNREEYFDHVVLRPEKAMETIQSSKRVLHRERAELDPREETEEAEARGPLPSASEREQLIAVAAYNRAQGRNFEPGRELEDWLEAEAEIDAMMRTAY
jgi:hypothetical protein